MTLDLKNVSIEPYWKSGVHPPPVDEGPLPKDCDAVVVGAGFTGLTTALHLARAGSSVVILDSHEIGHGCSSRSGGMCGPSFHKLGHTGLINRYGEVKAWAIMAEGLKAFEYFISFIKDEKLNCDLQISGRFRGATSVKDFDTLCATAELLAQKIGFKYHSVERKDQDVEIGTDLYQGGVVYERDAGVHPYKLTLELARKAREAGVRILEFHKVEGFEVDQFKKQVLVKGTKISTKEIVIATNGYTGREFQTLRRRLIPVASGVVATPDLGPEKIREMTPKLRMHGGTHRLVFWYRPTPDGRRMIFGGRVLDAKRRQEQISADLMSMARTVFPQLNGINAEFCWHGQVAYTFDHAPHLGQVDGLHYAMGYCGSGVTRSLYFAHKLSQKILGYDECETIYDDLKFSGKPFYTGNPWFIPLILRWHALADWAAGQR